jgi:uncharacterized membrane protein
MTEHETQVLLTDDLAQLKWKQLRKIQRVLRYKELQHLPPYYANILCFAALAIGLVFCLALVADIFNAVIILVAITSGIATGVYVNRRSNAPRSYVDWLDRLLAGYEPVAIDAYRSLQEKVKERGALDGELVCMWLEIERNAIRMAAGWKMPSGSLFLKKKV